MSSDTTFLSYRVIFGIFIAIFLSITGYFSTSMIEKLTVIQKELANIQIQIAETNLKSEKNFVLLSSQLITKDEIKEIVKDEIHQHIIEYHVNK